ncbi:MAG: hypothetical protein ACJ8BW_11580 [Ktedonobacteraceae bacterium]
MFRPITKARPGNIDELQNQSFLDTMDQFFSKEPRTTTASMTLALHLSQKLSHIKVPQKAARDEYLRQTAEFFLKALLDRECLNCP